MQNNNWQNNNWQNNNWQNNNWQNNNWDSIRQLTDALFNQYQTMLDRVMLIRNSEHSDLVEPLAKIHSMFGEVKKIESELVTLRSQLRATGERFPDDVARKNSQTIELISRLIPLIGELESSARQARDRLAPQIHHSVKVLQMRHAYGRNV